MNKRILITFIALLYTTFLFAQLSKEERGIKKDVSSALKPITKNLTSSTLWHGKERNLHYRPDGQDFILVNGQKRFNRAIYGTNTAFRVEAGDLPEFALYMPGMGGNLKFGIRNGKKSKWIIDAEHIATRYRAGSMIYTIKDELLGAGTLFITVLAHSSGEGIIVKTTFNGSTKGLHLVAAFGGATGKTFSRDGDIGADPESSFYLNPAYCKGNIFQISGEKFSLLYGQEKALSEEERYELKHNLPKESGKTSIAPIKQLKGIFPVTSNLKLGDALRLQSPLELLNSEANTSPVLVSATPLVAGRDLLFSIYNAQDSTDKDNRKLATVFESAEKARKITANRVKISTPDAYINTLGSALSMAEDGNWQAPSYLHGAIAWRMRLNAWRGPYVADALGLNDRAESHFTSYANSQVVSPSTASVVMDTSRHLARHLEKMGTSLFSSGYISRNPNDNTIAHHYDMNLVFIDALLTHFQYNGDIELIKKLWPIIKRHLEWEKRNFDSDNDYLYDAYAVIWASDALQYSGGGVTHSSSYNYRANKIAAQLAVIVGENPKPFQEEADKIFLAINNKLWMPKNGWYAEYKDLLGLQSLHPSAALWTIYHAIDSDVPNGFQSYQCLKYIDNYIPHIPIQASGLSQQNLYTLSTTNWQPYDWSLNNVALAEVLHTSLAYWQGGRPEEAYQLWKSALIESMYLSSSPGGFEQLSFYDAIRGELYRDFADPVAMTARSLVEGLFGIKPNALTDTLTIRPGFPQEWKKAELETAAMRFNFHRTANTATYLIAQRYQKRLHLKLQLRAFKDQVKSVTVNGEKITWKQVSNSIGFPVVELNVPSAESYKVVIEWQGNNLEETQKVSSSIGEEFHPKLSYAKVLDIEDPQGMFTKKEGSLIFSHIGKPTSFLNVRQGQFQWWLAVEADIKNKVEIIAEDEQHGQGLTVRLKSLSGVSEGTLSLNKGKDTFVKNIHLNSGDSITVTIPPTYIHQGTNTVFFSTSTGTIEKQLVSWQSTESNKSGYLKVDMNPYFNDKVGQIFKNKYLSPRPTSPTLQLPWQGIGNWCYPFIEPNIDDSGLRSAASMNGQIVLPNGIPLATQGVKESSNIVFTSKWDNYPDSVTIPLSGKSSHAYFLMAGSTNPMQSRMDNGEVLIYYQDGSYERLPLRNPENWWPIEQDYFIDKFAFAINAPKPWRVYLKTGQVSRDFKNFTSIKGFSGFAVDGGAATILDIPLNPDKTLKELRVKTLTNDVVIGLMAITLSVQIDKK